jgi:hypothetical protein
LLAAALLRAVPLVLLRGVPLELALGRRVAPPEPPEDVRFPELDLEDERPRELERFDVR